MVESPEYSTPLISEVMSIHSEGEDGSSPSVHEGEEPDKSVVSTSPASEWVFECYKLEMTSTINRLVDKHQTEITALTASFRAELNVLHQEIAELKRNKQQIDSTSHPVDFYQETIRALIQKLPSPAVQPQTINTTQLPSQSSQMQAMPKPAQTIPPPNKHSMKPTPPNPTQKTNAPPTQQKATSATSSARKQKRVEIIGDSMLGGVRNWYKEDYTVKVNHFGGATSLDTVEIAEIALRRDPDMLIVHVGTNDFEQNIPTKKEIQRIVSKARGKCADIKIGISAICHREDKKHLQPKIKDMNNQLKNLCRQQQLTFIDHSDFDHSCLAYKGLHPNQNGNKSLYCDFDRTISSVV